MSDQDIRIAFVRGPVTGILRDALEYEQDILDAAVADLDPAERERLTAALRAAG